MADVRPAPVAIFPWGDVVEEFLDPLGLTVEDYALRMRGGWLFGYVSALQAQGFAPIILYASERIDAPARLEHAETGAPIHLVPGRRSGGGRARTPSTIAAAQWRRSPLRSFARILRQERCAAMLVQDYEHARFDALALLATGLRLPLFASFQGGDVTLSPLERGVRRRSLRACRGLAVASARERQRLAQVYGLTSTVHDIANPVDAEIWRPDDRAQARAALGLSPDELVFLNHGRIDVHRKGLDVLLAAWREASPRMSARLVLIGSGQDRDAFASLLEGQGRVTWIDGYVTDPPLIRRWLSAADAYVTLSRVEGMPVAPLEAMACALPVISSDAHGLADIFADGEIAGGVLVPRERADLAAEAMLRLAGDEALRARLSTAARERVIERFSLAAVGEGLSRMLQLGAPAVASPTVLGDVLRPQPPRRLAV